MEHFWHLKTRETPGRHLVAPLVWATGDIEVITSGSHLDTSLVTLGCHLARGSGHTVRFLHLIEVPYTHPLKTILTHETAQADQVLDGAMRVAQRTGCHAQSMIVQARVAGHAIVAEAQAHHSAVLLIGSAHPTGGGLDPTITFVLMHAPCRVWLVHDAPTGILEPRS